MGKILLMLKYLKTANIYSSLLSGLISGVGLSIIFHVNEYYKVSEEAFLYIAIYTALLTIAIPNLIWVGGLEFIKKRFEKISLKSFIFPSSSEDLIVFGRWIVWIVVTGVIVTIYLKIFDISV